MQDDRITGESQGSEDFQELMQSVSFELERDLRLHPQKLELGKMELLTDSIRLKFATIENRLREYVMAPDARLRDELRAMIKRYLAVINANPLFPLHFRLKVLGALERHLDLFDAEMTSQVLNAHKIGIQLVQREARKRPEYRGVLVDLIANALELAEQLLFDTLRQHRAPHVIAMRQALDLMRLGLLIAPTVGESCSEGVHRLRTAVAAHELLRCMDMYARSDEQQQMIRQELRRYCERVTPELYARGRALPAAANVYLLSSITQPHLPPMKMTRLPGKAEHDVIVMPLDALLAGINRDLKLARKVRQTGINGRREEHGKLLMTEKRYRQIMQGTAVIRHSLQSISRRNARHRVEGARALIETNMSEAFDRFSTAGPGLSDEMLTDAEKRQAWSVVNISEGGAALQRLGQSWGDIRCGALIGIRWVGQRIGSPLAIVRWFRESKPGEQSLGIEFVRGALRPTRGMLVGDQSVPMSRRCSLLFEETNPKLVWFPFGDMQPGASLIYLFEGEGIRCHVARVKARGPNYSLCELSFDQVDGHYFTVQAESLL